MKRYSEKRQAIIDCLKSTKEHPSAEWIYSQLKSRYPDLSLGTVYRNLNELKREGEAVTVAVFDDKERYDAKTFPHTHAICEKCGKIIDVEDLTIPESYSDELKKLADFTVHFSKLQFVGLCSECSGKQNA